MKDLEFKIKSYFKWRRKSLGKRGYGIHSPFLFHMVSQVIHKRIPAEWPNYIEDRRKQLQNNQQIIEVADFGTGRLRNSNPVRSISTIAKNSSTSARKGRLLYQLASHMQCQIIVELGTNFGLGSSYLAHATSKPQIITLEGCPAISAIASETFNSLKLKNVTIVTGEFSETLPGILDRLPAVDLVFFDGNHQYQPTMDYFNQFLPKIHNQTVFVFDDIHQSIEMEKAWNEIIQSQKVTLSLDFYRLGVVFFKQELSKEHFNLRF